MARTFPDPTSHPPPLAGEAPETLAWVALLATGADGRRDALGVVDTDPRSPDYGRMVGRVELPDAGNALHQLGWAACRTPSCHRGPDAHAERRYLVVPGTGDSRAHVLDTRPDPRAPRLVQAPDEVSHEVARHAGRDTVVTRDPDTADVVARGLDPALLADATCGHALHVWDVRGRRRLQAIDLGAGQRLVCEVRPAHNPTRAYGFAAVMLSADDLSASVFLWYLDRSARGGAGEWKARRVVSIPAEPANPSALPPMLSAFGVVPPLVTDINLSVDDRFLYVSCWGTGELRQYDVSDPFNPVLTGRVRLGGIVGRTPHPGTPRTPRNGGPQAVEVSRDGRRVYVTNAMHPAWDAQCYPAGIDGWMARLETGRNGGLAVDPGFLCEFERGMRPRRLRLEGGDASSGASCHA